VVETTQGREAAALWGVPGFARPRGFTRVVDDLLGLCVSLRGSVNHLLGEGAKPRLGTSSAGAYVADGYLSDDSGVVLLGHRVLAPLFGPC
jgi:hypothetical protein